MRIEPMERNTVGPWNADEFVKWRGFNLVYQMLYDGKVSVHLPGRTSVDFNTLLGAEKPRRWRKH